MKDFARRQLPSAHELNRRQFGQSLEIRRRDMVRGEFLPGKGDLNLDFRDVRIAPLLVPARLGRAFRHVEQQRELRVAAQSREPRPLDGRLPVGLNGHRPQVLAGLQSVDVNRVSELRYLASHVGTSGMPLPVGLPCPSCAATDE